MSDLNQILELIKAGEKPQARQAILEWLADDPENEQAWLYLASCATNKREFEVALQQVLKLNPLNSQALKLAQQYKIPLPKAAQAMMGKKTPSKAIRSLSKDRRQRNRRLVLLGFLLVMLLILGAVLFLREGDSEPVAELITEPTAEATSEPTAEATSEPTIEPTAEATSEPTIEPTAEATSEPTAEPTIEVALNLAEILQEAAFVSDEAQLETYPANAPLSLGLVFGERPQDLALSVQLQAPDGNNPAPINQDLPAAAAETLVLPLKSADELWADGLWQAEISLDGEVILQIQTLITALATPTPTNTPRPTRTPSPTPSPTSQFPEIEPNIRLVYSPEFLYLQNISEDNLDLSKLRFVQQTPNQEFIFEATEWQAIFGTSQALGTTYALQPKSCFQTGVNRGAASTKASECLRLNSWVTAADEGLFWLINNGNVRSFLVFLNRLPIAECQIDAGECEFGLPQVN